jgi:hypothetical protein
MPRTNDFREDPPNRIRETEKGQPQSGRPKRGAHSQLDWALVHIVGGLSRIVLEKPTLDHNVFGGQTRFMQNRAQ